MDPQDLQAIKWQAPWEPVKDQSLVSELHKELGPGHPLSGKKVIAVGRRTDSDDVLFHVSGSPKPFALVHLTWKGAESSPEWPSTQMFNKAEECFDSK